jgi:hypothetical protein
MNGRQRGVGEIRNWRGNVVTGHPVRRIYGRFHLPVRNEITIQDAWTQLPNNIALAEGSTSRTTVWSGRYWTTFETTYDEPWDAKQKLLNMFRELTASIIRVIHPRRQSSSHSPPWEPQISPRITPIRILHKEWLARLCHPVDYCLCRALRWTGGREMRTEFSQGNLMEIGHF